MKNFLIIILLFCFTQSFSQLKEERDSIYKYNSHEILQEFFQEELGKNNIALFSIGTANYLIIVEHCNKFKEYTVTLLDDNGRMEKKLKKRISKPDKLLESLLQKENYRTDFVNLSSNFFKDGYTITIDTHNDFYFVLVDKNQEYFGETFLPIGIVPNPIRKEIYDYLFSSLINSDSN